jgi:Uma2 family endonuclease
MATAPAAPLVSVQEYLNSSYEHDMEYVDGVLIERGMPTTEHCRLQKLLLLWFVEYEQSFGFEAIHELRTQIIKGARYRIPDLMLCPWPRPESNICDVVPLVVIEILSPDDKLALTRERFRDYAALGVRQLILMDPEECITYRFDNGSLIETTFEKLALPDGSTVPFDSTEIFERLRKQRMTK